VRCCINDLIHGHDKKYGLQQKFTTPYSPEQHGMVTLAQNFKGALTSADDNTYTLTADDRSNRSDIRLMKEFSAVSIEVN